MQGLLTLSRCTSLVCLSVLYPQGIATYLPSLKLILLALWCHATLPRLVLTSSGLLLLWYSQTLYFCCYGTQSYWLSAFMILIATNLLSVWFSKLMVFCLYGTYRYWPSATIVVTGCSRRKEVWCKRSHSIRYNVQLCSMYYAREISVL